MYTGREDEAQEYGHRVVVIREKVHEAGGGARRLSVRNNASARGSPEHVSTLLSFLFRLGRPGWVLSYDTSSFFFLLLFVRDYLFVLL